MSVEVAAIIVAAIAALPPTLAVLWHKRVAGRHWEKQEMQNDEIITLVNGRLAKLIGGVEARLRALEAEVRRLVPE